MADWVTKAVRLGFAQGQESDEPTEAPVPAKRKVVDENEPPDEVYNRMPEAELNEAPTLTTRQKHHEKPRPRKSP